MGIIIQVMKKGVHHKKCAMLKFETIYKLTPYFVEYEDGKELYPSFKLSRDVFSLHRTWQQAMKAMSGLPYWKSALYCWTLSEIPLGIDIVQGESFSEYVFDKYGAGWCGRPYTNMYANPAPKGFDEEEFSTDIFSRRFFPGRKPDDLHFAPGDIIEVFYYEGNPDFNGDLHAELAIVVDLPPSVTEISQRWESLDKNDIRMTGNEDFDKAARFGESMDKYKVIFDSDSHKTIASLDNPRELVCSCPTHCAMRQYGEPPAEMCDRLMQLWEMVK